MNHKESTLAYGTRDFAASASMHRCAYLHSCSQGVCELSVSGSGDPAIFGLALLVAFRSPPTARSDATLTEELLPLAQSSHKTTFVDGDQCARSPTLRLIAHTRHSPAYFSEMKRRIFREFHQRSSEGAFLICKIADVEFWYKLPILMPSQISLSQFIYIPRRISQCLLQKSAALCFVFRIPRCVGRES